MYRFSQLRGQDLVNLPDIGKVAGYVGCDGSAKELCVVENCHHDTRLLSLERAA